MAYVNGTTHYNLPQTVGTDKRDWADTNQAFADIDAAIYGAVDDVAQAETDISDLKGRMTTAEGNITTNAGDISALDTRLTTAEGAITSQAGQITDVRQDLEDMISAYNEATATSTHAYAIGDYFIYNDVLYKATQAIAIGDTIVPDTNCETTNVSTEIKVLSDAVADLDSDISGFAKETLLTPYHEDSTTATRAYAIGDKVAVDGTLRVITSTVAIGDTIDNSNSVVSFIGKPATIYSIAANGVLTWRQMWTQLATYIRDNIPAEIFNRCRLIYAGRVWYPTERSTTNISFMCTVLGHTGNLNILTNTYGIDNSLAIQRRVTSDLSTASGTFAANFDDPYGSNVATDDCELVLY